MKKSKILIFIGLFQLIGFTAFANHTEDNYPDGDQRGRYHSAPNYNKGSSTSVGGSFSDPLFSYTGEMDLLKYDSEFSSSDNVSNEFKLRKDNWRIHRGKRWMINDWMSFEGRVLLDRYVMKKQGKFHARCFLGGGVEAQLAIDWLDFHVGQTICRAEFNQTEIFVTDTSNPQRNNPYKGSMDKLSYGFGGTFRKEPKPSEFSLRVFVTVDTVALRIYDTNRSENPGDIMFDPVLGLEVNWWP